MFDIQLSCINWCALGAPCLEIQSINLLLYHLPYKRSSSICVTANVHWFTSSVFQTKQFPKKLKLKLNFLLSKMWLLSAGRRFQQGGPDWNATIILESNRLISLHSSLYLPRRWTWVKAAAQIVAPQTISMERNKGSSFQRALWMCCTLSLSPLNRQMHTLRDIASIVVLHIIWDKWQF